MLYFHDHKYAEASKNFKRALDLIESQSIKDMPRGEQFYLDFKKLLFTNRSFNYFEVVYNIVITEIMNANEVKAIKFLKLLI